MKRKWYKEVNGQWVEAPDMVQTDKYLILNYNCDANAEMLRRDGYVPENEIPLVSIPSEATTIEERVAAIEQVTEEVITTLNDKNIIP